MKKILCPVDFSANSLNAIEFAARMGEVHQAELTLFHVFTEDEFGEALSRGLLAERYRQTDLNNLVSVAEELLKNLTEEVNSMSQQRGLAVCNYHFSYGALEKHISEFAKDNQYSLIVMGTAGVKDVFEEYTGSQTVKTLKRAECPVLCIPEKVKYKKFTQVVYATDYQQEDDDMLQQLISWVQPFDAAVQVLHIYYKDNDAEEAVYHDFVIQIRKRITYQNITFNHMKFSDAVHGIDRFAIDQKANLVALYNKKRNLLERIFDSSSTDNLSYFATYPIIYFNAE